MPPTPPSSPVRSPIAARSSGPRRRGRAPRSGPATPVSSTASRRGATRRPGRSTRSTRTRARGRSTPPSSRPPKRRGSRRWSRARRRGGRRGRRGGARRRGGVDVTLPTLRVFPARRLAQAAGAGDQGPPAAGDHRPPARRGGRRDDAPVGVPAEAARAARGRGPGLPIYVLKANTIAQMQASLTSIFSLEVDPREAAMCETEQAIRSS